MATPGADRTGSNAGASGESPSATYAFCIVESDRAPKVPASAPSLPAAGRPRVLSLEPNMWLVAADAARSEYSKPAIEQCLRDLDCISARAVVHEATIASFFERWPVIPLKLFTIFDSDERALHHLRVRTKQIRRVFNMVRDHQEWGVRCMIDPASTPVRSDAAPRSGRGYLQTKKRRRDQSTRVIGTARKRASAALGSLARLAAQTRRIARSTAAGSRVSVIEAAYLVPVRRSEPWAARARQLGAELIRHGCRVQITGPWPPYNFVSTRRL